MKENYYDWPKIMSSKTDSELRSIFNEKNRENEDKVTAAINELKSRKLLEQDCQETIIEEPADNNMPLAKHGWACPVCETSNSMLEEKCSNSGCGFVNGSIDVKLDDEIVVFSSITEFAGEIENRNYNVSVKTPVRKKIGRNQGWAKLIDFSKDTLLEAYIYPVWSSAKDYILIGILIITSMKAIDTTIFFYAVDIGLGIIWTISLALFIGMIWNKVSGLLAFGAIFFIQFKFDIGFNIFITFITIGVVGAIFGIPLGLVIGTVAGYIRKRQGKVLFDAPPEKQSVFVKGIVVPVAVLFLLVYLYIFVLNPIIIKWMES